MNNIITSKPASAIYQSHKIKVIASGFAFVDNRKFKEGKELAKFMLEGRELNPSPQDFFLFKTQRLNGSFSIIIDGGDWLFAAVDRVRSRPLFYSTKDNNIIISNSSYFVRKKLNCRAIGELAKLEFLLTGFVTGEDTLFPEIKQLQAGEYLWVEEGQGRLKISKSRYYRFLHGDYFKDMKELYSVFDKVLINVFSRLIQSIRWQTIVVPLSGGLDSRLVVAMLKRLNYSDVICFSYGKKNNLESRISEQVAKKLKYRWIFIPYTRDKWHELYHSSEMKGFFQYDNLISTPLLAVREIKRKNLVPKDAIFIPGHTGDFLSGKHIPLRFAKSNFIEKNEVVQAILNQWYFLWDWSGLKEEFSQRLYDRVNSHLKIFSIKTPKEAANAFDYWDWQEKEAKQIVNSVRVYDFWRYGWRIPLLDNEMMDFFAHMPLNLRLNQFFYRKFLKDNFPIFSSVPIYSGYERVGSRKLRTVLGGYLPHLQNFYRFIKFMRFYFIHPMQWHGINTFSEYTYKKRPNFKGLKNIYQPNVNSFVVSDLLKNLEKK